MKTKRVQIRRKQDLQIGRRYKGSAVLNEYGEFDFRAYQKQEDNQNAMRKIFEEDGENYRSAAYHSAELVKIALLVPRGDAKEIERRLRNLFILTLYKLKEYDI